MKRLICMAISLAMLFSVFASFPMSANAASMSDADFFAKFDYAANPALSDVKECVDAKNYTAAKAELLKYFKNRKENSTISGFGITEDDENYSMAVLPMRNILTGPYEFDMWQAEFDVTSSSYQKYSVTVTDRIASQVSCGAVSFMLFAGDKQRYPVLVESRESSNPPVLNVTYSSNGDTKSVAITPDNDTYISSANTSATYGDESVLYVKEDGSESDSVGSNTRRAYFNFPLTSLANSSIISAELVFSAAYAADCTTGDKTVLVINIGDTIWSEDSLTWAGTRGSIYSYQDADYPTWNASAPNCDGEYHNVTSRFWFAKPMAYEYLSYLENPAEYNAAHPYADTYPGEDFGPKLVELMDAFATQMQYGYTRTLETGERLNRWVDVVDALLDTDVFDTRLDEFCNIISFMWGDCNYLSTLDISNGSYWWSNWRIVANAGFFKAVEYLPEFSAHDTWREKVEYNVEYTFDLLYNSDYSFTEAGPSYAAWCAKLFGDCIKAALMSGNPMSAVFTEKVKYAARNALESYYPNGYDSNIGDSNYRDQMYYFESLDEIFNHSDNIINSYVSGKDKNSDYLTHYYDSTNSAYMRNSWDPNDAVYVNFTNNPSDGHYHPDSNQVLMYAYGSPLLVDSGRYSYASTNSIYNTLRTAQSHNTIEADGLNMGTHSSAAKSNALTYKNTNDSFDFFASTQNGYSDVSHTRNVFFSRSGFGIVTDYVTGSSSRAYRQNWHFMPSSGAKIEQNVAKTAFTDSPNITIAVASASSAAIKQGYHSADYGLVSESNYASFEKSGSTVKFDSVLYPDRAGVTTTVTAEDLAENDSSKSAIKIVIDGKNSYYYVKNTSSSDGTFASYTTDAKMAYVSDGEYMIADGKKIVGKIESPATIASMGVTVENGNVSINGEKLVADTNASTAIKIYAPNAKSVCLNGQEVEFSQNGDYIYAVASSVSESVTGATAKVYPDKDGFYASSYGNEGASANNAEIFQAAVGWQNRNAYMAFDLSDFENKEITKATLNMKMNEPSSQKTMHFYYLPYGTWTRNNLSFVLNSSGMPSHTKNTGTYTGYDHHWSGDVSGVVEDEWVQLETKLPSYISATDLPSYLSKADKYKFTWAMLSDGGSAKFYSIGASEANRPYLEITYNYQSSSEGFPKVVVRTYRDGVLYSSASEASSLGSVYIADVEDSFTDGDKTYYLDRDNSSVSTFVKKSDNVLEVYYKSGVNVQVEFEDVLGNTISKSLSVSANPNLSHYTYSAPPALSTSDAIYTLDYDLSTLSCNLSSASNLKAVYRKTGIVKGENLITNGSFEDENGNFSLSGWTSAQTGNEFGSPYSTNHCYAVTDSYVVNNNNKTYINNTIPDGNWAFGTRWNDANDGLCSLKRYVAVESGKTYKVSYDVKHKTGADGGYIVTSFVADANSAEGSNALTPGYVGTTWQTFETTFTATDATDHVLFWFRWLGADGNPGNGPYWYFDNFKIVEIEDFDYTSVTLDGKEVLTDGTITLGKNSSSENIIGYNIVRGDDTLFAPEGNFAVQDGDIITSVPFNVSLVNGAQVRYGAGLDENGKVNDGNGLRFIATVDTSSVNPDAVLEYGIKIQPDESTSSVCVPATTWQDEDHTIFTVAITNLLTSNYNRTYSATGYVTVKYCDGTTKTFYSKDSVERSIYHVAVGLLKTSESNFDGDDYTVSGNNALYNVLNAYVNSVGIRLTLSQDGSVTPALSGKGKYSGDVFFSVTSTKKADNVYTITVAPLTQDFNNPAAITDYWDEFIRINNNHSTVKNCISNASINSDGSLTFDFEMPQTN